MSKEINILCYGDSNTYGYDPLTGRRFGADIRWSGILQNRLGAGVHIIEEGCNGRTTIYDDPLEDWKNGLPFLKPCLNTHKPVDIVILMLGSNDLKDVYGLSAEEIAEGAARLVDVIQEFTRSKQGYVPQIILVSPPRLAPSILTSGFSASFSEASVEKSAQLSKYYKKVSEEKGCIFLDASEHARVSEADGLHFSEQGHRDMADALEKLLRSL